MEDDEYDPTPKLRPTVKRRSAESTPYSGELPERFITKSVPTRDSSYVFKPICNIESYIHSLGVTGEKADEIRRLHYLEPEPAKEQPEKFNVPSDPLHVFVNMKVLSNGTVRVKLTAPMEPVYEYQRKGKMAPIDVRIRAAKGFGYPDYILEKMLLHDDYMKKNKDKLDDFIDKIFGKSILTKTSKPKAKSVHEALSSKFKKMK